MKQMITRLDDELHAQLKARAAAESLSLNGLVAHVLAGAVDHPVTRQAIRERARAAGLLVVVESSERVPTRAQAFAATQGLGQAASDALFAQRQA
ncbi:MAG: toxin-antitoxin system HicB family antitoxin [Mycobacteriales bacterium]